MSRFQDHVNTNPLEDVLMAEELLKLKAEVGAAPPGFTVESEPAIDAPPGGFMNSNRTYL
jgi:hypothetical protein